MNGSGKAVKTQRNGRRKEVEAQWKGKRNRHQSMVALGNNMSRCASKSAITDNGHPGRITYRVVPTELQIIRKEPLVANVCFQRTNAGTTRGVETQNVASKGESSRTPPGPQIRCDGRIGLASIGPRDTRL